MKCNRWKMFPIKRQNAFFFGGGGGGIWSNACTKNDFMLKPFSNLIFTSYKWYDQHCNLSKENAKLQQQKKPWIYQIVLVFGVSSFDFNDSSTLAWSPDIFVKLDDHVLRNDLECSKEHLVLSWKMEYDHWRSCMTEDGRALNLPLYKIKYKMCIFKC